MTLHTRKHRITSLLMIKLPKHKNSFSVYPAVNKAVKVLNLLNESLTIMANEQEAG